MVRNWKAAVPSLQAVKYLLEKGANVNEGHTRQQWTCYGSMKIRGALHQAARNQHEDLVALLIEQGGDVRLKDTKGKTPSFYAYEMRNDNIMKMVLEKMRATE